MKVIFRFRYLEIFRTSAESRKRSVSVLISIYKFSKFPFMPSHVRGLSEIVLRMFRFSGRFSESDIEY